MSPTIWRLVQDIAVHDADARSIVPYHDGFVTTGYDNQVLVHEWDPDEGIFREKQRLISHAGYVYDVAIIPPSEEFANGAIVTASADKSVIVWDTATGGVSRQLLGHTDGVVSVDANRAGLIVSGSADNTARIWMGDVEVKVLTGHGGIVWDVHLVGDQTIVTACADTKIRVFQNGECLHVLSGHSQPVRSIHISSADAFLSVGNDRQVITWARASEGDSYTHRVLAAEDSFLYSCTSCAIESISATAASSFSSSGEIAIVGGEGRMVYLRDQSSAELLAALPQPAAVWGVTCLSCWDVAACCSDGNVRVWSVDSTRWLDEGAQKEYEKKLGEVTVSGVASSFADLPGPEVLDAEGRFYQRVVVKISEAKAEMHMWVPLASHELSGSGITGRWLKIGQIAPGGQGSRKKTELNGKMYDYVFDVDLDEAQDKIAMNAGDNPFLIASEFIEKRGLDPSYLEQIASFLVKSTGPTSINTLDETNRATAGSAHGHTRAGSPTRGLSTQAAPVSGAHVAKSCVVSGAYKLDQSMPKIKEFSQMQLSEHQLLPEELDSLNHYVYSDSPTAIDTLLPIVKKMRQWSVSCQFPVVDLARFLMTKKTTTQRDLVKLLYLFPQQSVLNLLLEDEPSGAVSSSAPPRPSGKAVLPTRIFVLRMFGNLIAMGSDVSTAYVHGCIKEIVFLASTVLIDPATLKSAMVRSAALNLFLNLSVSGHKMIAEVDEEAARSLIHFIVGAAEAVMTGGARGDDKKVLDTIHKAAVSLRTLEEKSAAARTLVASLTKGPGISGEGATTSTPSLVFRTPAAVLPAAKQLHPGLLDCLLDIASAAH